MQTGIFTNIIKKMELQQKTVLFIRYCKRYVLDILYTFAYYELPVHPYIFK